MEVLRAAWPLSLTPALSRWERENAPPALVEPVRRVSTEAD